jgi:hypothetical protein
MLENITHNGQILALIIRADFQTEGIKFFTPANFSQQLGYMNRPKGFKVAPHIHNLVQREVQMTQEVLFIKRGRVQMDIFDLTNKFLSSHELAQGDVVLLASGGHGFTMLEETEIIEVKTGPHLGEIDKTRFNV